MIHFRNPTIYDSIKGLKRNVSPVKNLLVFMLNHSLNNQVSYF